MCRTGMFWKMKVTDMIHHLASNKGMYKKQEVRVGKVRKKPRNSGAL